MTRGDRVTERRNQQSDCDAIDQRDVFLWVTGWGMPNSVFDGLRGRLRDYQHFTADIQSAHSPEDLISIVRTTALACGAIHSKPALVVGWSLGGLLAFQLAMEGIARGLVLIGSTACFVRPVEERMFGWSSRAVRHMKMALQRDQEGILCEFRRSMFTSEELGRGLAERIPAASEWTMPALLAGLQFLQAADFRDALLGLTCPVLLLHGTEDQICPIGAAKEIQQRIGHAEFLPFEGSGHLPFLDHECATVQAIRKWRGEHLPESVKTSSIISSRSFCEHSDKL